MAVHNKFRKSQEFETMPDEIKAVFNQHVATHQYALGIVPGQPPSLMGAPGMQPPPNGDMTGGMPPGMQGNAGPPPPGMQQLPPGPPPV